MPTPLSLSIAVSHALAFLVKPLEATSHDSTLRLVRVTLEDSLIAHYLPSWNDPESRNRSASRCLTLSNQKTPPKPIYDTCLAARVKWSFWVALLTDHDDELDLFVDPGCVSVRKGFMTSWCRFETIWSAPTQVVEFRIGVGSAARRSALEAVDDEMAPGRLPGTSQIPGDASNALVTDTFTSSTQQDACARPSRRITITKPLHVRNNSTTSNASSGSSSSTSTVLYESDTSVDTAPPSPKKAPSLARNATPSSSPRFQAHSSVERLRTDPIEPPGLEGLSTWTTPLGTTAAPNSPELSGVSSPYDDDDVYTLFNATFADVLSDKLGSLAIDPEYAMDPEPVDYDDMDCEDAWPPLLYGMDPSSLWFFPHITVPPADQLSGVDDGPFLTVPPPSRFSRVGNGPFLPKPIAWEHGPSPLGPAYRPGQTGRVRIELQRSRVREDAWHHLIYTLRKRTHARDAEAYCQDMFAGRFAVGSTRYADTLQWFRRQAVQGKLVAIRGGYKVLM